jgi:hypothetical protein
MSKVMLLMFLSILTQMFAITVDGHAFLEGETDHSGIEVFFQRVVPDSAFTLTAFTNSSGYFSGLLEGGYYDITYSKSGFTDTVVEDLTIYSDQTLAEQTLTTSSNTLEGSIKGILHRGEYNVTATLTVLEGDSLIIEPGVILNFSSEAALIMKGHLKSEGSETDSIIFKPEADDFGGILFNSQGNSSSMKYCSIKNPLTPIVVKKDSIYISRSEIFTTQDAIVLDSAKCIFEHVTIHGDDTPSSAIVANWSVVEMTYCKILDCRTGLQAGYSSVILDNLLIKSDGMGIVMLPYSNLLMTNCSIYSLWGIDGLDNLSLNIHNSNIISRVLYSGDYGITFGSGEIKINNTNVYGFINNFDGLGPYIGVNVTTNSNGDPCDAYGNISMDPKFVDAANGDFSLQSDSPCIDSGTNTITDYTFPVADLGSCIRIWDGNGDSNAIVDMGAYEYGAPVGIEYPAAEISDFVLYQNYPNPFNPVTAISYALPNAGQVELNVYNLNGQLVQSLVNGKMDKGVHKAEFNGADLTSGMYIYNLKVDGKAVQSKKMMLLK